MQCIYVSLNLPLCPTLAFPSGVSFTKPLISFMAALVVKNLPADAGDIKNVGSILGWEDPLEQGMATHSSILAWKIPWTEKPDGLQSMGLQRIGHD